jgi:hypothetical protein
MDEDAVFDVVANAPSKSEALTVASEANQVLGVVVMFDARDLLLDDGAGVQVFRGIVAGGADELHAPFERPLVGVCSDESRQEGVVNVDDAGSIFIA